MFGPEIRDAVQDDEPDGEPEPEARAAAEFQGRAGRGLALLVDDVRGRVDAEVHPDEERAEERAVEEVDGEGVLAEPEEVLAGEDVLDEGREVDAQRDKEQTDAGVEAWDLGLFGEDEEGGLEHVVGPGHEVGVELGVGG